MITHVRELITPEIAERYLAANQGNRNIRNSLVNKIARDIKNDLFVETHQGIAFDEDGTLIDGQHRLLAVIKAQKPIVIDVARNVPRSSGVNIDTGASRGFSDIAFFDGRWNDEPSLRSTNTIAVARQIVRLEIPTMKNLTTSECFAIIPALAPYLMIIHSLTKCKKRNMSAAVKCAALAALMCGESEDDIAGFFDVMCSGDPSTSANKNTVIVFNWREQMFNAKVQHRKIPGEILYSGTQNAIWNYCRNTSIKQLRSTASRRYPVKDDLIKIIQGVDQD